MFSPAEAVFALTLGIHTIEEDLLDRHPEASVISQHLWIVWEETLAPRFPSKAFEEAQPLEEDDYRLGLFLQNALWEGRRFFPYKKAII